jgi:general stress protein YciG
MTGKSRRGFASMDPEKRREIASKGGKAAHAQGSAHEFTPEEARVAGRKGGEAAHARGTAHQFTPEEAREAGRKGGQARSARSAGRTTPAQTMQIGSPILPPLPPGPPSQDAVAMSVAPMLPSNNLGR